MRPLLLLLLFLLGCGGGSPSDAGGPDGRRGPGPDVQGPGGERGPGAPDGGPIGAQPGRRPSDALKPAPDPGKNKSSLQDPGPEMKIRVTMAVDPGVKQGQLVFLGVPKEGLEEGWVATGRRPSFFWVSPMVSFEPPIDLMAPLPRGLHYFAVVNLDGDDLPGPDDLVSDATPYGDGEEAADPLEFVIRARLSDVLPDDTGEDDGEDDEAPGAEGGEPRTLIIANDVRLPFIRTGRFMVVGLPPSPEDEFGFPPDSSPSFLWASDATRLKWPVTLEAILPDAVDLLVVLDLDASGAPDVGDLTTEPIYRFRRPPAGESVTVTLETVVPVPSGESGEDEEPDGGDPNEGPPNPNDPDPEPTAENAAGGGTKAILVVPEAAEDPESPEDPANSEDAATPADRL